MSEIIKFNCDKFTIIEDDPRFITCKFFFGLVGENYNGSIIEREDYEANKNTIGYTPICGYFSGSDFKEHDLKERPLGTILSFDDCDYSYEELKDGKIYACVTGIIQKEYLSQKEIECILKNGIKKISIEIEVFKKEKLPNGKFIFREWIYQCITILGDNFNQGMGIAHLEVLNNPREKYATFIEQTIETFSKKETKNPFIATNDKTDINKSKKEVDVMNEQFKKAMEKFGLNSNQIIEIINNTLSQYKYQNGDYEYGKYYITSFDDEFVYVYDNEDGSKTKRMTYEISENVAIVNLEDAEDVISAGYMPCGMKSAMEEEMETMKVQYAEMEEKHKDMENKMEEKQEQMAKQTEEFESTIACHVAEKETIFSEKETMSKQLEEKQETIITMGQELDTTKAEFAKLQEDMVVKDETIVTKDEEIAKYVKQEKEMVAEKFISQYTEKLTEDEQKELKEKVHTFVTIEEFQKEIKAFVCDKYEEDVKGKTTNASFSYLGYIDPNLNKAVKGENWTDYLGDYNNNK